MANEGYKKVFGNKIPLIQVYGVKDGQNEMVQIIKSDGVTEGYIDKGADIIVDNTQTGSTLKEYGLKEIGQIMDSSAGLYGGPSYQKDEWIKQKAEAIRDQLLGVVTARKYNDVKFNVPRDRLYNIMKYLKDNHLYSQSPTVNEAGDWFAINIIVLKELWPRISQELKTKFGASGIVRSDLKQLIL